MQVPADAVTRTRWRDFIAAYPLSPQREYRRKHPRHDVVLGAVELAFELGGKPVQRSGALLNASPTGILVRQRDQVPYGTPVLAKIPVGDEAIVVFGRAVHCTQTVGGYKLGVELRFADDSPGPVR